MNGGGHWRVLVLLSTGLATASILFSVLLYFKGESEQAHRTDQACILFERAHKKNVVQYTRTLDYLAKLTPAEKQRGINKAVVDGLKQTRQDATADVAPTFCNDPGVGLGEPNPAIPKLPK